MKGVKGNYQPFSLQDKLVFSVSHPRCCSAALLTGCTAMLVHVKLRAKHSHDIRCCGTKSGRYILFHVLSGDDDDQKWLWASSWRLTQGSASESHWLVHTGFTIVHWCFFWSWPDRREKRGDKERIERVAFEMKRIQSAQCLKSDELLLLRWSQFQVPSKRHRLQGNSGLHLMWRQLD